jgi:cytosine/adenosine deaminase-related metal-dependent hydrolase
MILRAGRVLLKGGAVCDGGGVRVAGGKIAAVLRSPGAVRRAARETGERVRDLGEGCLAPGLVDAHAHLELTGYRGRLSGDGGFVDWIGGVLALRRRGTGEFGAQVAAGEELLVASGTTTVGDVASTDASARARRRLRSVVYREVLDAWDPERTPSALAHVRRALPARSRRSEGFSPHAPYTTSGDLLRGVRALTRRRRAPVTTHWSETAEEVLWLCEGRGPLQAVLGPSPRTSGLELLARAGLLRRGTSLVHGNHPGRGEPARLARAGVVLVHCPGTHAFFGREPFALERYRRAGVRLALGTDSLASNGALDMRREMALLRRAHPDLAPGEVLALATTGAARALGLAGRVGELRAGAEADLVLHALPGRGEDTLEALTNGEGEVESVWIGGRKVR